MITAPQSQAEFYLGLYEKLLMFCCDSLSLTSFVRNSARDLDTLYTRVSSEGLGFLTKTLPQLGKALDKGLRDSAFSCPRNFARSHENRFVPAFLQVPFNAVFDEEGKLRDEADPKVIEYLRIVLFLAYKLELPYSEEEEEKVLLSFQNTEEELKHLLLTDDRLLDHAARITSVVFEGFDPLDISPRHGPGQVAQQYIDREDKWDHTHWYTAINAVYPYYDYFLVGGDAELEDRLEWWESLVNRTSGTARVTLVPKDSRGPRLISMEPSEYMWLQQGLGRKIMDHLERHFLTSGNINFTHQEVNQNLATEGSIFRNWATMDLKDASDRVSLELVRRIFSQTPSVLRGLEALRTTATILPNGKKVELAKYAPMGSALCFPVEAYCFWVLLVAARVIHHNTPLRVARKEIYVYGDDIIVPTDFYLQASETLEKVGLKVNETKSYYTGAFRESCGTDSFKGVNVTPIRLRTPWAEQPSSDVYSSYVALANQFRGRGYCSSADYIWSRLERVYGKIPYGSTQSSYPCRLHRPRHAQDFGIFYHVLPTQRVTRLDRGRTKRSSARDTVYPAPTRKLTLFGRPAPAGDPIDLCEAERINSCNFPWDWNSDLQRLEFLVKSVRTDTKESKLDGWHRLQRNILIGAGDEPGRRMVPYRTSIVRSWKAV